MCGDRIEGILLVPFGRQGRFDNIHSLLQIRIGMLVVVETVLAVPSFLAREIGNNSSRTCTRSTSCPTRSASCLT